MASKDQPKEANTSKTSTSSSGSTANVEDVLRPFQEASSKLLQANLAAQESAVRQHAQTWLDYQEQVRNVEQEAYRAVLEATRKHIDQLGQQATGGPEQVYATRMQAQFEYENELRRVYADAQAKVTAVTQKVFDESQRGETARQFSDQQQDAYKTYLSDLQEAWSGTRSLEPQTMNAIASHILTTMNAVSQTG